MGTALVSAYMRCGFHFDLGHDGLIMPWYVGTLIGGISLALMNSVKKSIDLNAVNFLYLLPLLIIVQLGFWYGFRHGNNFVVTWFTGSAMSASSAILISLFYFGEPFRWQIGVGVLLIILGQICLIR